MFTLQLIHIILRLRWYRQYGSKVVGTSYVRFQNSTCRCVYVCIYVDTYVHC